MKRREKSEAEQIADAMRRRQRVDDLRWWEKIQQVSSDHRPVSLLTLKPYRKKKVHPVWVYWLPDRSGLAAFRPVGKSTRVPVPVDAYGLNKDAMLAERVSCQALLLGIWKAHGITEDRADDLLALWLEFSKQLAHVNELADEHMVRILQSKHRSVREAAMRMLALVKRTS